MTARLCLAAALLSAFLAGCNAHKQRAMALEQAQTSLEEQFPQRAQLQLDKADKLTRRYGLKPTTQSDILRAEAHLQLGELSMAKALGQEVSSAYVPGTVERAEAEEILAKVAIREGQFVEAQLRLSEAQRSYTDPADLARVGDLTLLVQGLQAYAQGETLVARSRWDSIGNEALRKSVLASVPAVATNR
jgi:Flp pilus assembly protein TadD